MTEEDRVLFACLLRLITGKPVSILAAELWWDQEKRTKQMEML